MMRVTRRSLRQAAPALVTAAIWIMVGPRMVPVPTVSDRGTFISVAERMLAGDALYAQVWDNKDPLFYYANAAVRLGGPLGDVVLEAMWLAIAMISMDRLAHLLAAGIRARWGLACLATPIVLTGHFYFAGHTHLPGTAVGLAVIAAMMERRFVVAGGLLGLLVFLKITAAPVVGLAALAVVLARGDKRALLTGAAGFASSAALMMAMLGARGELTAYGAVLVANFGYADPAWLGSGAPPWLAHLQRVWSPSFAIAITAVGALLATGVVRLVRRTAEPTEAALWWASTAAFGGTLVVLALTAYWPHHAQALYLPALLSLTLAVSGAGRLESSGQRIIAGLLLAAAALGTAGVPRPADFVESVRSLPHPLHALVTPADTTQIMLRLSAPTSYARIGPNDVGTAWGLREWDLACPRFHQYPFDPPTVFDDTIACLAGAPVVLVAGSPQPVPGRPAWNGFLADVEGLLSRRYACERAGDDRICLRRPGS